MGRPFLRGDIVFWGLALVFLAITVFLHFYQISVHPAGLHVDEGSVAFNARCIAETGMDEHMTRYPVFFKCFGDYKNPLMIYFLAPVVDFFGMTKTVIRTPSGIFHILASMVLYFLVFKYCRNRYVSLVSVFVFSILPWIFPVSRLMITGFTAMLLFLISGSYLLFRSFNRRSYSLAVLSGLLFALSMCSTHSGRPVAVIILACVAVSLFHTVLRRWRISLVFCLTLIVCMLPVVICVLMNPGSLSSRFSEIAVWNGSSGIWETVGRITGRYVEYFCPDYLFISGDSFIAHCTRQSGSLYLFMIPFIVSGIVVAVKYFRWNPYYRFLVFGLLFYPVAASLTIGRGHSTCCLNGTVFFVIAAALGARYLWYRRARYSVVFIIAGLMAIYEVPAYFHDYFTRYRIAARSVFSAPQYEAIEDAWNMLGGKGTLYISRYIYFPEVIRENFRRDFYTNIIFITGISPKDYFRNNGIDKEKVCIFDGKIRGPGLLLRLDRLIVPDESGKLVARFDFDPVPAGSELLKRIPTPSGINFEIYRVK